MTKYRVMAKYKLRPMETCLSGAFGVELAQALTIMRIAAEDGGDMLEYVKLELARD